MAAAIQKKVSAADVLAVCRKYDGYVEGPNNDTVFGKWYGVNNVSWCAIAVSYMFCMAGLSLPITTPKGFAYCPYGVAWFKKKGWWTTANAKPGYVVFYDFVKDGISEHVGILDHIDPETEDYLVWEGNTSVASNANGGQVMLRHRNREQILGFGVPKFTVRSQDVQPDHMVPSYPAWSGINYIITSPFAKGSNIMTWQKRMKERGWNINTDGIFNEATNIILKKFQKEKGLKVDGVLGASSWQAAWKAPVT